MAWVGNPAATRTTLGCTDSGHPRPSASTPQGELGGATTSSRTTRRRSPCTGAGRVAAQRPRRRGSGGPDTAPGTTDRRVAGPATGGPGPLPAPGRTGPPAATVRRSTSTATTPRRTTRLGRARRAGAEPRRRRTRPTPCAAARSPGPRRQRAGPNSARGPGIRAVPQRHTQPVGDGRVLPPAQDRAAIRCVTPTNGRPTRGGLRAEPRTVAGGRTDPRRAAPPLRRPVGRGTGRLRGSGHGHRGCGDGRERAPMVARGGGGRRRDRRRRGVGPGVVATHPAARPRRLGRATPQATTVVNP